MKKFFEVTQRVRSIYSAGENIYMLPSDMNLKRSLACYFDEKHILKLFPLSSCQYVSTIPGKKTASYRPLKNRHFVRVCTEKTMDHQYRENGAKYICSNYNQMRTYC